MANVVTPANLGNEFDFGVIEPSKIHIKTDETTVFRDTATGIISAYTVFTGPALPPAPGVGDPIFAIDDSTGITYGWDGAVWVPGGSASPYSYSTGTDAITTTILNGNDAAGDRSTVSGGSANTTDVTATEAFVGAGQGNSVQGASGAIVGGDANAIASAGTRGFIGGGSGNSLDGAESVIGGGQSNSIGNLASTSVIVGGDGNSVPASSLSVAILGGASNTASQSFSSVVGGENNTAGASHSTAMGDQADASFAAEMAHGLGEIGGSGAISQFRRFRGHAATVGPGSAVSIDFAMPTNGVWAGRIVTTSRDATFGGSIERHDTFGARAQAGVVFIDGFGVVSAYGGGTLTPLQLSLTVTNSGGNVRVTLTNSTVAVTMDLVVMLEVLEIRR